MNGPEELSILQARTCPSSFICAADLNAISSLRSARNERCYIDALVPRQDQVLREKQHTSSRLLCHFRITSFVRVGKRSSSSIATSPSPGMSSSSSASGIPSASKSRSSRSFSWRYLKNSGSFSASLDSSCIWFWPSSDEIIRVLYGKRSEIDTHHPKHLRKQKMHRPPNLHHLLLPSRLLPLPYPGEKRKAGIESGQRYQTYVVSFIVVFVTTFHEPSTQKVIYRHFRSATSHYTI